MFRTAGVPNITDVLIMIFQHRIERKHNHLLPPPLSKVAQILGGELELEKQLFLSSFSDPKAALTLSPGVSWNW